MYENSATAKTTMVQLYQTSFPIVFQAESKVTLLMIFFILSAKYDINTDESSVGEKSSDMY